MNTDLLEFALLDELKTMKRLKRLEFEFIEEFDYAFHYVMKIADQNKLKLPNYDAMLRCLKRMAELQQELSPEAGQRFKSPDYGTEPSSSLEDLLAMQGP